MLLYTVSDRLSVLVLTLISALFRSSVSCRLLDPTLLCTVCDRLFVQALIGTLYCSAASFRLLGVDSTLSHSFLLTQCCTAFGPKL